MRLFHRLFILLLCLGLMEGSFVALGEKPKEGEPKPAKKKKEKNKGGEQTATPAAAGAAAPGDDGKGRLSIPLIPGHDSRGIKIPYYDTQGNLQMTFNIGVATRLDPDNVRMSEMQVETFNEEGESDMVIELPTSVLNLSTRVITSNTRTTIRRDDFTITGDSVEFNTLTRQGRLVGNVHMTINDLNAEIAPEADAQPE